MTGPEGRSALAQFLGSDVVRRQWDVRTVQLRCKGSGREQWLFYQQWSQNLRRWAPNITLIVNDRPDLALFLNTDGVHVGQDDIPVAVCRALLGEAGCGKLVGLSAHTIEQATREDVISVCDYIGLGPFFVTATKQTGRPPVDPGYVREIVQSVTVPVVAVGGITQANMGQVLATGVKTVAMISGFGEIIRNVRPSL
ncbi:MAG: thiamine phosphate synthase [Magnetococcales bacterium]|nr:thiamine phosphate synthase [Magnetococcales bacterium]